MLILVGLVALAFYFDRGSGDHDQSIDKSSKTNRLTR